MKSVNSFISSRQSTGPKSVPRPPLDPEQERLYSPRRHSHRRSSSCLGIAEVTPTLLFCPRIEILQARCFLSRESDRDVVGTASSIFIVSSVKVPTHTTALITSELNHQLPDQRINAIYRFQVRRRLFNFFFLSDCRSLCRSPACAGFGITCDIKVTVRICA